MKWEQIIHIICPRCGRLNEYVTFQCFIPTPRRSVQSINEVVIEACSYGTDYVHQYRKLTYTINKKTRK